MGKISAIVQFYELLLPSIYLIYANFLVVVVYAQDNALWNDYLKCKDTLGKPNWLCDPNSKIYKQTADELNNLLWHMQTDVPCYCQFSNDCYRSNGPIESGVVGAMVATQTFPPDVHTTAKRIYDDAKLETANCGNGLLVVYAFDGPKIYTYRGKLTQFTLPSDTAMNIMNRTVRRLESGDDRTALQDMVKEYTSYLKGPVYERRESSWGPIVGMVVACVIAAFAFAIALAIFFASCCCKKRKKPWRQPLPPPAGVILPPGPPTLGGPEKSKKVKEQVLRALKRRQKMNQSLAKKQLGAGRRQSAPGGQFALAQQTRMAALQGGPPGSSAGPPPPGHPLNVGDEPYYVISEPSTMYSTLQRVRSPVENLPAPGGSAAGSTKARGPGGPNRPILPVPDHYYHHSPLSHGGPTDSPSSQAFLIPPQQRLSPLMSPPEKEIQRRDIFVADDDQKTIESAKL